MKGGITIWVLVFGSVFLIILSATIGFLVFQIKENQKAEMRNTGFHIAEAGINYSNGIWPILQRITAFLEHMTI